MRSMPRVFSRSSLVSGLALSAIFAFSCLAATAASADERRDVRAQAVRQTTTAKICPGPGAQAVLRADAWDDRQFDDYRWFKSQHETTVAYAADGGAIVQRLVELPEWHGCPEIDVRSGGTWYALLGGVDESQVIAPFTVAVNDKPSFSIKGVPEQQIRPRSRVELELDISKLTGFRGYRVSESTAGGNSASGLVTTDEEPGHSSEQGSKCAAYALRRGMPAQPEEVVRHFRIEATALEREIVSSEKRLAEVQADLARLADPCGGDKCRARRSELGKKRQDLEAEIAGARSRLALRQQHRQWSETLLGELHSAERGLLEAEQQLRTATTTAERTRLETSIAEKKLAIQAARQALAAAVDRAASPSNLRQGTKIVREPRQTENFEITVVDGNGCSHTEKVEIPVRKAIVDLVVGTEFSTYNSRVGKADDMDNEEFEDVNAFSEEVLITGLRVRHAFARVLEGLATLRFGGLNVEVPVESMNDSDEPMASEDGDDNKPPNAGELEAVVRDARVVDLELAMRWAFMEQICGKYRGWLCKVEAGDQIQLAMTLRYGFSLVADNEVEIGSNDEKRNIDDFLDSWFVGLTLLNDNPGQTLDESYVEIGLGRSDNFLDNSSRLKIRSVLNIDLPKIDWDLLLAAHFDSDGGGGADELRVMIGFQRDLPSFLPMIFGN